MQSDHNNIEKLDNFSREVGEKLRDHRIPVDTDVWETLVGKLPSRDRRLPVYWLWAAAGIAAMLLGLILFLNLPADEHAIDMVQEGVKKEPIATKINESEKPPLLAQNTPSHHRADENRKGEKMTVSETSSIILVDKDENESILPDVITESTADSTASADQEESGVDTLPKKSLFAENDHSSFVKKESGNRSLMAALGSGGAPLDFTHGSEDMYNPIYDSPVPGGEFGNGDILGSGDYRVLSPGDYTDIVHRPPVSISVTADFPIGKNVSLETGLSYTYLFSRFRRNDQAVYRGTLKQHYIGLPLNLRYRVWQDGPRHIYLLAGGSIEKGIRADYQQEIELNGGVVQHTNVHQRIAGFQLSAQGGAGFSYRLNNSMNLFGEPRLTYYFRNNQPMSARTENPLVFGLNVGIRIQFE